MGCGLRSWVAWSLKLSSVLVSDAAYAAEYYLMFLALLEPSDLYQPGRDAAC